MPAATAGERLEKPVAGMTADAASAVGVGNVEGAGSSGATGPPGTVDGSSTTVAVVMVDDVVVVATAPGRLTAQPCTRTTCRASAFSPRSCKPTMTTSVTPAAGSSRTVTAGEVATIDNGTGSPVDPERRQELGRDDARDRHQVAAIGGGRKLRGEIAGRR